ncbi:MAG: response regulator [Alphaproteobacteria bacterium]|nr:response regulator [Alphaproteobacteria bacterium]
MEKSYISKLDPFVGARIRRYRKKLGWSLGDLAEKIFLSCQQLQKYEQGKTRISVGVLYQVSLVMGIKSDQFFEGFEETHKSFVKSIKGNLPEKRQKPIDILLLEHNPEDALITRKAIEKSGIPSNFHIFHSGDKVLEFLKDPGTPPTFPRPEIIILELNTPRKEGQILLKEIKRDRRLCDIPVIVLTNSVDREEMIKCYQHYAAGFIRKPLNFKEYCEHISLTLQYWSQVVKLPRMDSMVSDLLEKGMPAEPMEEKLSQS